MSDWAGGQVSDAVDVVLCPNPGPMTLDGTNTWLIASGSGDMVVIDPGPHDEAHLRAVLERVEARGGRVALTLFTHGHFDHVESAPRWAELTGAPTRGAGHGGQLQDDERITVGDLEIQVLLTPGHTSDSVSFGLPSQQLLFTGDTVLGRGTSIIAHPDGNLTDYLASLDRLRAVAPGLRLAPGHGPTHDDAAAVISAYIEHRHQRLDQVRAALAGGAAAAVTTPDGTTPDEPREAIVEAVVERVYADVPRSVWPAARATVRAQLDYLGVR